jgi:hypothetical protein
MRTEEQEVDNMYYQNLVSEVYLDAAEEIEHPPVALSMGYHFEYGKDGVTSLPIPLGTYGNFIFVQAPPKSCKSFFVSLLSAVYLNDSVPNRGGALQGHREGRSVVHFDTEQGRYHALKVFKRPYRMTGKSHDEYDTIALRAVSANDRLKFIEYYLENEIKNVGLVIIDGVADLCNDVNNIEEGNLVAQKLMELSSKHNCLIITVIHSNHNSDKPTGHLGSALEKKAETQIQLEQTPSDGIISVKCKRSRNRAFAEFFFKVDKYGLPKLA